MAAGGARKGSEQMKVCINGVEYPAYITDRNVITSRHSGRELDELKVEIVTHGRSASDVLVSDIERARREKTGSESSIIIASDTADICYKTWRLTSSSFSYSDSSPLFTHRLTLHEVEELSVQQLVINDLVLEPYEYQEELDSFDSLTIRAKVVLEKDELDQLHQMVLNEKQVQVIRKGISETPVDMRFGLMYWSPDDGGRVKHEIYLHTRDLASTSEVNRLFHWVSKTRVQAGENKDVVAGILQLLERKQIITAEETAELYAVAKERKFETALGFYEMEDIDVFDS